MSWSKLPLDSFPSSCCGSFTHRSPRSSWPWVPSHLIFCEYFERTMETNTHRTRTIPLIVARMVLLFGNLQNPDSDLTYNTFNTAIIMEIHTMLSIVVACFPFTKPLMDSLSTGLLTSDLRSATARSAARSRYPRFGLSSIRSPKIVSDAKREWFGPSVSGNFSTLDSGEHELTETSHPKDMVINRTITTTVEFEGDDKIYETKV